MSDNLEARIAALEAVVGTRKVDQFVMVWPEADITEEDIEAQICKMEARGLYIDRDTVNVIIIGGVDATL